MRRFKFSLQTVLDVRRVREEKIQKEFSAIQTERADSLGKIRSFEKQKDDMRLYQREMREKRQTTIVSEDWCMSALSDFTVRIMLEARRLQEINERLDAKREELIQAQKDRKVLEQLEEKQREEYMNEAAREEQKFIDELAQHQKFYALAH